MGKLGLILGLMLLFSPLFGQRFVHNHYQIFQDERFEQVYYRMYWTGVINETQVLMAIRSVNGVTGSFHNFLAFLEKTTSRTWSVTQIEGDGPGVSIEHRQILEDLRELLRISATHVNLSPTQGFGQGTIHQRPEQVSFHNQLNLIVFNLLVPTFSIRTIRPVSQSTPTYTLYQTGSINFENQSEFFSLIPLVIPVESEYPGITSMSKTAQRILGPLTIATDNRWITNKTVPNRIDFSQNRGNIDAYFSVELISPQARTGLRIWGPNDLNSYFLAHREGVTFAHSLDTSVFQGNNRISFYGYNVEGDFRFYSYFVFMVGQDMYVQNFISNGHLYQQNVDYFRSILDSVRLVDSP